ncbi:TlpA family protein disulfide reductase [Protaetiibacter intestinalis]|uniref:TlpA family protein disulfide reductase n=1 Tax=Protaetiibacter intestinalis TaxID=2419774 RepID=A0A387B6U7_9MICO|nr:TlpA family protein disulfide reductase [Protaetiibacter intestinalis]
MRAAAPLVVLAALLTGCTPEADHLAGVYESGNGDYISGDGRLVTLSPEKREAAVEFAGTLDTGDTISSDDLAGRVVVVNFWYAACPPCREEAADLEKLNQQFADAEVTMLGVNVSDSAETAQQFEKEHGVGYPSIVDVDDNAVQLAFAGGAYAPNSVPTTLVLDRDGRVAARFSGLLTSPSVISDIVDDLLAETA